MSNIAFIISLISMLMFGGVTHGQIKGISAAPNGERIGVINLLPSTMKHYHVGTTLFHNFIKEYRVDWNIAGYLNNKIKRKAAEYGSDVVFIGPDKPVAAVLKGQTVFQNHRRGILRPESIPILKELSATYDISKLLIIEQAAGPILLPNMYVNVQGYGVGTRNFLALGSAEAFAMIDAAAICLKQFTLTDGAACRGSRNISGLKTFGNFRELSEDDLKETEKTIKAMATELVARLVEKASPKA